MKDVEQQGYFRPLSYLKAIAGFVNEIGFDWTWKILGKLEKGVLRFKWLGEKNVWGKLWSIQSFKIFASQLALGWLQFLLGMLPEIETKGEEDKILQRKGEK